MNLEQKLKTMVLGVAMTTVACSDQGDALNAAHSAGWGRDTKVTGTAYVTDWTCDKKEKAYSISGTNPARVLSSATVCCGHMSTKGCTIRY